MGRIIVDMDVLEAVARCVGTTIGDVNYIWQFDVNQDGVIDILDLVEFAKKYGEEMDIPEPPLRTQLLLMWRSRNRKATGSREDVERILREVSEKYG